MIGLILIVVLICGAYVCSWISERGPSIYIGERPDQTTRQIANGFRPDGSHDFDPEMEPGVRVCEVDRLEQWWKSPTVREEPKL